jgi:hypothetical protein
MALSIHRRIFTSSLLCLAVGGGIAGYLGTLAAQEGLKKVFEEGLSNIAGVLALCLFAAGIVIAGSGLLFLVVPSWHPACRQMKHYGPLQAIAKDVDAQLRSATELPGRLKLTRDWLVHYGLINVSVFRLEALAIAARLENERSGQSELLLADHHLHESLITLDGFEITRILTALRQCAPHALFDLNSQQIAQWQADRRAFLRSLVVTSNNSHSLGSSE